MEAQKVAVTFFLLPFGGRVCFGRKGRDGLDCCCSSLHAKSQPLGVDRGQAGPGSKTGVAECEPSKKAV